MSVKGWRAGTSPRSGPFYGFARNDRVYASLRWSFAAS